MATIKYKGMELEEITEPQIFDPPKTMVVDDGRNGPRTDRVEFFLNKKHRKYVKKGDLIHIDGEDYLFDGENWKHMEGVYVPKSDKPAFNEAYTRMLERQYKRLSERVSLIEQAERKAFQKGLALGPAAMWAAYIIVHLIGGVL